MPIFYARLRDAFDAFEMIYAARAPRRFFEATPFSMLRFFA